MQRAAFQHCAVVANSSRLVRAAQLRPILFLSARQRQLQCQFRSLATSLPNDPNAVRILEVGPRDGLQNIKQTIATPLKVELIRRLAATGLNNIEATSFVSPKWIPQLADGPEVMSEILPLALQRPMSFPVLVPNSKGLERAIENGAKEIVVFASATEGFSKKNTNCTVEEALQRAQDVTHAALKQGIAVRGVVSCIFSCPYDGPTPPSSVLKVVKRLLDMGCYEVGLGDTLGVGTPRDVEKLLDVLLAEVPADKLAGHYHDTYGQAVANVVKSYDMGLRKFDSSVAGLGGCPYAKGAKGNLATEDIAYTFERLGVRTGIDLDKLVLTGQWISQELGLPNGSRAGSALFAKQESAATATSSPTPTPAKRAWEQIEDNGDYKIARSGNVIKITLTRPRKGNTLSNSMVVGLTQLFTNIARDPSIFHIVLAAEGKFFCTGMDLSTAGDERSSNSSAEPNYYSKVIDLFAAIDNAPQTTIAMVDGPCFGGGVGLTFVCDIRLLSEKVRFTMTEIKLGLSPAIISKYMAREWGIPFMREAMLTGREVTPAELQRIGAVHGVAASTEALEQMTEDYLDRLKLCAPRSAAACKELVRLAWNNPGGQKQADKILHTFENMMVPGSEGSFGIAQFRQKVKKIDWGNFWTRRQAKL